MRTQDLEAELIAYLGKEIRKFERVHLKLEDEEFILKSKYFIMGLKHATGKVEDWFLGET